MAGWPWPLDAVQSWFESLWNYVYQVGKWVVSWLWDSLIYPAVKWILDKIVTIGEWLWSLVKPAIDWLWSLISPAIDWVVDTVRGFIEWIWDGLQSIGQWLYNAISGFVEWLWSGIQSIGEWISNTISGFIQSITAFIETSLTGLWNFISGAVSGLKEFIDTVLHGALEGLANIVLDGLRGFWDFITGGLRALAEMFVGFIDWAISSLGGFFTSLITNLINQITPSFQHGSPPQEMSEAITNWATEYQKSIMAEINKGVTGSFDIKSAEGIAVGIGTLALGGAALGLGLGMAADSTNPMKNIGIRELIKTMLSYMGTEKLIAPLFVVPHEEGVITALRQHFKSVYTLGVPRPEDLALMSIRESIADARYSDYMYRQGMPDFFQDAYKDIAYRIPDVQIVYELYWRGIIAEGELEKWLKLAAVHPDLVGGLVKLAELIPATTDLVTMVVREAFVEEMVTEAPEIFAEYMIKKGFTKEWADRYWTMHWVPAPLRDAREMVYRGFWTEEQYMKLLKIADYHPIWREDMTKVIYTVIGRIDLRRAWELGVIDDDELVTRMKYLGYNEEDAILMADIHKAIAMGEELGKIRDEAIADYKEGFIDEGTLESDLKEIGIPDAVIEYYVIKAKMRRDRELSKETMKIYLTSFRKDVISETELRGNLQGLKLEPDWVDVIVKQEIAKKGHEVPT